MRKTIVLVCIIIFISLYAFIENTSDPMINENKKVNISFLAVGDNLIHSSIYRKNQKADGSYDLNHVYEHTNQYTQNVDVSYINFETICAGKELTLSNYPLFNGPFEVIDAVNHAGFDWLSGCSNHSFDKGEIGVSRQLEYVRHHYPHMMMTGLHDSQKDADECKIIERKGVKIGLLSYTYGLNSFVLPDDKSYLIDIIDKDKIKNDIEKLKKQTDLQLVSMHWGNEYQFSPTHSQLDLAQYLSDLGADVVIGTHPHVIQPMEYLTGKNGNKTLVMYSLGNFLSAQDVNNRMLGGMVKWNIEYNKVTKDFQFKDVQFIPTVTQIGPHFSSFETYALKDWNDELGKKHHLYTKGQEMTRDYFIRLVNNIISDDFEKIY